MIAKLWANQIAAGKRNFNEVPPKLKNTIKAILMDMNCDKFE